MGMTYATTKYAFSGTIDSTESKDIELTPGKIEVMNHEREYIRLWNAAEQALENIDFEKRFVNSWAALRILKNAVDWGRDAD